MQIVVRNRGYEVPEFPLAAGGGFAFGLHRAGSTMLFNSLSLLTHNSAVRYFDFDRELRVQQLELERRKIPYEESRLISRYFDWPGVVFGGWRQVPTAYLLPLRRETKTSLLVRDPRDAVTSLYFSDKYSHTTGEPDGNRVLAQRKQTAEMSIDEWVKTRASWIADRFSEYEDCLAQTDLLLRRYEDIVFSKESYFSELCSHFGIEASPEVIRETANALAQFPETEDIHAHVRQVRSGDHKRKLKAETIEHLNGVFADVLARFDYPLDARRSRVAAA